VITITDGEWAELLQLRASDRALRTENAALLAQVDSLTIAVRAMGKRADDAEAALVAGDACGAVGCRALAERDALRSAIEAAIDSLTRWNGDPGSLVVYANIRHLQRSLDGPPA